MNAASKRLIAQLDPSDLHAAQEALTAAWDVIGPLSSDFHEVLEIANAARDALSTGLHVVSRIGAEMGVYDLATTVVNLVNEIMLAEEQDL